MYPLIKFGMIKKAVDFFSKNLKKEEKETIAKCLDMIKFGMSTTFIQFKDQYWLYGGGLAVDEKGLTIGGFESAWLADLVAAYIFQNSEDLFTSLVYYGTYRDDGLSITDGKESTDEICDWLDRFQERVNLHCGSDSLKFTMEVWNPDAPESEKPKNKRVKIVRNSSFSYLDTEMY